MYKISFKENDFKLLNNKLSGLHIVDHVTGKENKNAVIIDVEYAFVDSDKFLHIMTNIELTAESDGQKEICEYCLNIKRKALEELFKNPHSIIKLQNGLPPFYNNEIVIKTIGESVLSEV